MGKQGPMLLGGHRGMGENLATTGNDGKLSVYPAFRENTIHSFQEAAKCGVGFVEFDVQVTRDNVPVIWHDDDVVLGSEDHPRRPQIKDLTLAELQALCGRRHSGSTSTSANSTFTATSEANTAGWEAARCSGREGEEIRSGGDGSGSHTEELLRRFRDRKTREWANRYQRWACEADDGIPTLEAVFSALPPEIGFDIEIKMTTGDDIVHTPAEEVDRMLGAILPVVDRCAAAAAAVTADAPCTSSSLPNGLSPPDSPLHAPATLDGPGASAPAGGSPSLSSGRRRRHIMFSSFDPDVCVELRRRQAAHPVYYLSGCGLYQHADARRTSIPAAISFAAEAGMQGIVVPASILLKNQAMVADASRSHLELMTYGLENNDLDCLKTQADLGVAAAIVDEVAGVTAALGAAAEADEEGPAEAAGSPKAGDAEGTN